MNVLFIDSVHPILWEKLNENHFKCIDGTKWSKTQIFDVLPEINGVVIRSKFTIDKSFLEKSPNLKFIARSGSGLENIDVEEAKRIGIKIFNSPEGNRDAVAEHVLAMILCLFNKIVQGNAEVRQNQWNREQNRGLELKHQTFGIIGFGQMGSAVAERLAGFGCKILAYDKYKKGFGNQLVNEVSLEEIWQQANIVSFHVPYNTETHNYFNNQFITQMQKPFYVVNTSRGKILNTANLVEGLKTGKVMGACLDVLEFENANLKLGETNEIFEQLKNFENMLLTPHVAGWTIESYYKLSAVLADKILAEIKR